ncbi:MAG: PilN domain-containing protein [Thermodesulfobacteriota bacterium]
MIRINLLPVRAFKRKENIRKQVSIFLLTVVFVIGLCAVVYAISALERTQIKYEESILAQEVAALEKKVAEAKNLEKKEKEIQEKLKIIDDLEVKRRGPVRVMTEIARRIPANKAYLTELIQDKAKLSMKGLAMDNETVALFMCRLDPPPRGCGEKEAGGQEKPVEVSGPPSVMFKNVELVRSQEEKIQDLRLKGFTITCLVSLPEEEEAAQKAKAAAAKPGAKTK